MKIEKNIPMPKKTNGRPRVWDIEEMAIGDSLLFDNERDCNNVRYAMRHIGFKATQRKTREGWRIWRVS